MIRCLLPAQACVCDVERRWPCDDCGQCDIGRCTRGGAFWAAAVSSACRGGPATLRAFGRGYPNPERSIPIPTRAFAPHR
jgi:hypothetical protein